MWTVYIRVKTAGVLVKESETDDTDVTHGTTVKPGMSPVNVTMTTSSLKQRLFVENETQTYSTSINITDLEHFAEYMVKVCVTVTCGQTVHVHGTAKKHHNPP